MSWPSSFLVAALTGALGAISTGVVTSLLNDWFHPARRTDVGAAWLLIILAIVGGVVCFALGLVVSRQVAGTPESSPLRPLGISCGIVAAIASVVVLVGWMRADLPPRIDGEAVALAVEVRAPANFALPDVHPGGGNTNAGVRAVDGRARSYGSLDIERAIQVDGRWVITANVPLETSARKKLMEVRVGPGHDLTFQLPLRAHPNRSDMGDWSPWIVADSTIGRTDASPETTFSLRYRVRFSAQTRQEVESQRTAEEQAKFDALGADASIPEWMDYIREGDSAARIPTAVTHILSRPDYLAELAALMVAENDDDAAAALQLVPYFPAPQPAFLPPVAAAGRHIAGLIREVNANASGANPYPSGAQGASMRFTAWMLAVRALRETSGGDFTPELGEILVLSRVRPETVLLQESVRGVASHYMKLWANVEQLPGDPPLR